MPDVFFDLPLPPSINHLYPTMGKRRVLSEDGKRWYAKAIYAIREQTRGLLVFPDHRVQMQLWITFPDKRQCDLDNRIKAVLDSCTKAGVWTDDSQVDELHIYRCKPDKEHAGAKVMISAINSTITIP